MGIAVLGPVNVQGDTSILGPRDRVVAAALALRPGEAVRSERLADALWGEQPPATWIKVVQGCVARLRKVLGAAAIETTHQGYRLVLPADDVDAQRFERLVVRGRELLTLGEPERAAHVIGEGLALWRGRALVDLDGWSPGEVEASRLEELRLEAQDVRLDAALQAGRYREVLAELQARVTEEPLRERRWALLAQAQYQAGRQGEALRTLHQARLTLAGELGLDPGPDLVALEGAILRQDPALVAEVALPEPSATCPYLGLVAYDVGDAEAFFGRDADVAACLRRLASGGILAVVGPSGSGKSSLVRAGVAAALGRGGRRVAVVNPGARPCDALTVLPDGGPAPVLVVDQCEEAVTLCQDPVERARFFAALAAHAKRGALVVALRADRLGELSAHTGFARLIEPGLYLLGAMDESDLREAIQGPARQAGLLLEAGLVELLVREVEGEPGALPMLSHALRSTWERREGRTLTVEGYRAGGGIRGAIAQSAEELYEQVPPDQRPLVRNLLLRLVAPSADGEPVRSRVPRRTVVTDPAHADLIERLVEARLLTSDDGVIELAHEALARAWPRLLDWLDDDIEGQRILRHLTGTADTWDAMGRPDTELYRGARLTQAVTWRDRSRPDLTPTEQAFLDAGETLAESERQAVHDRARHQARVNRRLRALLSAAAIFLVVSIVAGLVAVGQRDRAEHAGHLATARELAAAADANVTIDPERSILLALEAVERTRSEDGSALPEAEEALHRAVSASRIDMHVPGVGGKLDWSPDGTQFVTEGREGSGVVDIRDARTGESVQAFHGTDVDISDVSYNHDGTMLATTGYDTAARIWDPATGERLHTVRQPGYERASGVYGPSFSPDGSLFAAAWPGENLVKVLDTSTWRLIREIRSVPAPTATSFDRTGARLAIASSGKPLAMVVDVGSGDELLRLTGHLHPLTDVAWSPDGASIATAGTDGSARIFDARTGRQRAALQSASGFVFDVDWSPDSTRIVTGNSDGTARVWLVTDRGPIEVIRLSASETRRGVSGVAFSPDGTRVITGDVGPTAATVWDVSTTGDAEVANLPTVAGFYGAADYTSDGRNLLATGASGAVTVWDAQAFTRVRTLGVPSPGPPTQAGGAGTQPVASGADVFAIDVSDDGGLVAAARFDGSVHVWDTETGREAFTVDPGPTVPGTNWIGVAWSPDGGLLAVAANDGLTGRVTIVDRSGRRVIAPLQEEVGTAVSSVAFSPDGKRLIISLLPTEDPDPDAGKVAIWDWKAGTIERTIPTPVWSAFPSPTGHLVATIGREAQTSLPGRSVDVWDSATGRHVTTLAANTGVWDLAFSPDGSRLATAGQDGAVQVWDPATGERLLVLRGHRTLVSSVVFSPDGSRLASVGAEGTVRVWALDLDDLVKVAEHEVRRGLTDEECRQYLHGDCA